MAQNLMVNNRNSLVPLRDDVLFPFESYFNKIFDEMWDGFSGLKSVGQKGFPFLDIVTENGKWIVEVSVPGVSIENLTVEVLPDERSDGQRLLKISGKMDESYQYGSGTQYQKKELRRSAFERSLYIPAYVKGEPEATLKNGILRLIWEVPELKRPEKKSITIKNLD
jgi:HSP20 family molecular chaperone IbpA